MKKIILLVLLQLLSIDLFGMVKLKDVTQKGFGTAGVIRVEFNGNYKESKAEVNYKSDHVEISMRDSFTLPANRVFKVSSEKSSVSKITSKLTPGNLVKLSIYFRTPMDVIQKTGKLSVDRNLLTFSYKTVVEDVAAKEDVAATAPAAEEQKDGKQPIDAYYKAMNQGEEVTEERVVEDNGPAKAAVDDQPQSIVKTYSSSINKLWSILKGILIIVIVVAFSIGVFYLYKRYSSGMAESMNSSFGRTSIKNEPKPEIKKNAFMNMPNIHNTQAVKNSDIKVLSSLELDHGKTVHVVEYMGERMLIATSKDSVTMLSRMGGKLVNDEEQDLFKNTKFKDRFGSDF